MNAPNEHAAESRLQRELEEAATDEDTRIIARILAEEAEESVGSDVVAGKPGYG